MCLIPLWWYFDYNAKSRHGTFVDTGSSVDITFKSALDQLLIESNRQRSLHRTHHSSILQETWSSPRVSSFCPLQLARYPTGFVHMINFLIVDHPNAYNIILRRPFLATTKAVISMHYLTMRIPIVGEIITIKVDQQSDRGCYSVTSKASYQIATNIFLKGYPVSTRPLISLSKRAFAKRQRVACKKVQRSTYSQQQ